ncbi:hypothetical protein QAD02_014451 [Eretmocerus hayati]|uniref:Uncharacterized protein n=1 Tax=Eretmocerus hayati TaxID=131215 RepID=A0ACC2P7U4_9HYME|nr:hypothetical protein QAD02_014451 [Eretmocerus hayati]
MSNADAQDNLVMVLKRFMDHEVLVLFIASRSEKAKSRCIKPIIKTELFASCLLEFFLVVLEVDNEQTLSESAFYKAMGNVINGARIILGPELVESSSPPMLLSDNDGDPCNDVYNEVY